MSVSNHGHHAESCASSSGIPTQTMSSHVDCLAMRDGPISPNAWEDETSLLYHFVHDPLYRVETHLQDIVGQTQHLKNIEILSVFGVLLRMLATLHLPNLALILMEISYTKNSFNLYGIVINATEIGNFLLTPIADLFCSKEKYCVATSFYFMLAVFALLSTAVSKPIGTAEGTFIIILISRFLLGASTAANEIVTQYGYCYYNKKHDRLLSMIMEKEHMVAIFAGIFWAPGVTITVAAIPGVSSLLLENPINWYNIPEVFMILCAGIVCLIVVLYVRIPSTSDGSGGGSNVSTISLTEISSHVDRHNGSNITDKDISQCDEDFGETELEAHTASRSDVDATTGLELSNTDLPFTPPPTLPSVHSPVSFYSQPILSSSLPAAERKQIQTIILLRSIGYTNHCIIECIVAYAVWGMLWSSPTLAVFQYHLLLPTEQHEIWRIYIGVLVGGLLATVLLALFQPCMGFFMLNYRCECCYVHQEYATHHSYRTDLPLRTYALWSFLSGIVCLLLSQIMLLVNTESAVAYYVFTTLLGAGVVWYYSCNYIDELREFYPKHDNELSNTTGRIGRILGPQIQALFVRGERTGVPCGGSAVVDEETPKLTQPNSSHEYAVCLHQEWYAFQDPVSWLWSSIGLLVVALALVVANDILRDQANKCLRRSNFTPQH